MFAAFVLRAVFCVLCYLFRAERKKMENYTYVTATGEEITVEVSEEMKEFLEKEDRAEKANDKKETRRHIHWEALEYEGLDYDDLDIVNYGTAPEIYHEDLLINLKFALKDLEPRQKELLKKVYKDNMTQEEIAKSEGVVKQAISNRMQRIYKKLEKNIA